MDPLVGIRDFLEFVLAGLVRHPDQAAVIREEEDAQHSFLLRVAEDDVARVLGRSGHGIMAIRNLAQAAAALHHMTVKVRVEEPVGGTPQQRPFRQQRPQNRRPRRR